MFGINSRLVRLKWDLGRYVTLVQGDSFSGSVFRKVKCLELALNTRTLQSLNTTSHTDSSSLLVLFSSEIIRNLPPHGKGFWSLH